MKGLKDTFLAEVRYIIGAIDNFAIMAINKFRKFFKNRKFRRRVLLNALFVILAIGIVCTSIVMVWAFTLKIPDLQSFDQRLVSQSTKIYDSTGNVLLYDLSSQVRRTVVPYDQISQNLKNATVAIEDKDFYNHAGIQPTAILRAFFADLFTLKFSQGGSTITQQVVKNSLLTNDKTIGRKIKEWILSIKLEKVLDKDSILNLYLNNTPYGGTIYGAEEASQAYFAKHAADLTVSEAAYLAAMANAPTYYSPYGAHRDALEDRKNLVLKDMLSSGYLTQDQYNQAMAEKVQFQSQVTNSIKAPHFVMYVKQYLEAKYGDEMLQQGGLKVITTLDYPLEEKSEELAKTYGIQNEKDNNASNVALVAIDPTNGQIRAMVGSRDYFDTEIDGNFNVATAHRQPGSTFKPIVYSEAFLKGYTPDTVLFDAKTEFSTSCSPDGQPLTAGANCYSPVDDDDQFLGPMTLRDALAQSRNIPAIKLLYLVGIQDSINLAKSMGITSLSTPDQYGLTLVLGGGEVSLLELTNAYGVFASGGYLSPESSIISIQDAQGNTLEQFSTSTTQVLPTQITDEISDILSDNVARTPAFGATSPLYFPGRDVAVKTGTTNDYRDAWVIGYTPHIVIGAWAGNNDNTPMAKKISRYLIVPFWNEVMSWELPRVPVETFPAPAPVDPNTKPILKGDWQMYDANGNPNVHSILYWVNKSNPTGPAPTNPYADPQFNSWEYGVQQWLQQHMPNLHGPVGATSTVPILPPVTTTPIVSD